MDDNTAAYESDLADVKRRCTKAENVTDRLSRIEGTLNSLLKQVKDMCDKVDKLDKRLEGVDTTMKGMNSTVDKLEKRLVGVDTTMKGMKSTLDKLDNRLEGVDTTMKEMKSTLDDLYDSAKLRNAVHAARFWNRNKKPGQTLMAVPYRNGREPYPPITSVEQIRSMSMADLHRYLQNYYADTPSQDIGLLQSTLCCVLDASLADFE